MRRKLFNLATTLSLVVCVSMSMLWTRSVFIGDNVVFYLGKRQIILRSVGGLLSARSVTISEGSARALDKRPPPLFDSQPRAAFNTNFSDGNPWSQLGFWRLRNQGDWRGAAATYTWVSIPFWFLVLVSSPLAFWWCRRKYCELAARRRREGCCLRCGYDLRATPDRCPECGTATTSNDQIAMTNQ